ncbi:double-strand break repair protein AddB [Limibaculum sp. M0105]|uniref:Double-strand break repair protein AddB n=1 Tax=Thermohalobaculum xanthum TaxID=2753746 RepID=A0A8J7SGK0_9RHOB|nr:double-strand break repair protein AddB [Thermohalobaculum xanthum]MBK0399095.1 double-strand break repair protein AddB [Thermohalobaculum xanthum]
MTLFAPQDAPRVFAVPPGADYAAALAEGIHQRLGAAPPEAAARIEIRANTPRAARAIEAALAARAIGPGDGAALLPRVGLLSALADDPLALPHTPRPVDPLRRRLALTRLIERFLETGAGRATPPLAAAPDLADSLADLIDELDEWGIPPGQLDGLVEGDLARHWQEALAFADIVRSAWPRIRAEIAPDPPNLGAPDPAARARRAVEAIASRWAAEPPAHSLIAAASTGARAMTAPLMAAIARLPQGAVVLPGFDPDIEPEVWRQVGPDHPMGPFRAFLDRLDLAPSDVRPWTPQPRSPRLDLLAQALRPAPVTDAWVAAAPALRADAAAATEGLSLIEARNETEEAAAIAIAIRRAIAAPGCRAALVTRDGQLARRVGAELARFGIEPDDALGRPLADSAAGVFLRLIAAVASGRADPLGLVALMQHPLCTPGMARGAHLRHARAYEIGVLRRVRDPGLAPGRLPSWPTRPRDPRADWRAPPEGFEPWHAAIEAALAPLVAALADGAPLAQVVEAHAACAEALSTPDPEAGQPQVWLKSDGQALRALMRRLADAADAYGPTPVPRYAALLTTLMRGETLRPEAERPHPRVMIWGTREVRAETADLVILGGLNEGSWPPAPGADAWLSRPMRATLGLPAPEREIGLSAHDFLQAAARPQVVLSRALRSGGAPTVASRWLVRLENLLQGIDGAALAAMRARGQALRDLVPALHRPDPAAAPLPAATRPAPRPPRAARPRRLSVTRIETLIRDAYAIYAERILRLSPLDPLGKTPDFLDRGNAIHAILHRFVAEAPPGPADPVAERARLLAIAEAELRARIPWPATRRAWAGRLARAAQWFVDGEAQRRGAGHPVGLECRGRLVIDLPGGPFELTATADRIDAVEGGAMIYDYKAGSPPSPKQIGVFAQQLHLQALILEEGGFEGVPAMQVLGGAYLGLTGSGKGGAETTPPRDAPLRETLGLHRERLIDLLTAYESDEMPYLSRGRAEFGAEEGTYDHLARRAEWEAADPGGGGVP